MGKKSLCQRNKNQRGKAKTYKIGSDVQKPKLKGRFVQNYGEHFHHADCKNHGRRYLKALFLVHVYNRIAGNQDKKNYKRKNVYAGDCRKIGSHKKPSVGKPKTIRIKTIKDCHSKNKPFCPLPT